MRRIPPGVLEGISNRSADVRATRDFAFPSPRGVASIPNPGGGPQLPPRTDRSASAGFLRQVIPPWIEKLGPVSRDFGVNDYTMILPAGVGSTVKSTGLRFQVPKDQVGWLQQFRLYAVGTTAATTARWTLRINEGPIPGFDDYQNTPGVANLLLLDNNDLRIPVPMGAVVDVLITNLGAGGPWTVGGRLAGWYHPLQAEIELWGER